MQPYHTAPCPFTRTVDPNLVTAIRHQVERCGCRGGGEVARYLEQLAVVPGLGQNSSRVERATYQRGVDVAVMWQLAAEKLYKSNDTVMLATREALQNSVDAVRAAYRSRQNRIERGTGYFLVTAVATGELPAKDTWSRPRRVGTLIFEDNGVGMDRDTIVNKFMNLGGTGKGGADYAPEPGSPATVGGFGMAKAIIFAASTTGKLKLHTRNWTAETKADSLDYDIRETTEYRQGTRLVLEDVILDTQWSSIYESEIPVEDRIRFCLSLCNVGDVNLAVDLFGRGAEEVPPTFPPRRGSIQRFEDLNLDWGQNNKVTIKTYSRGVASGSGALYIRLGGLFQFRDTAGAIPNDLVIDIETTNTPQQRAYPLNASREEWSSASPAARAFRSLTENLRQQAETTDAKKEWTTLLPDSDDPRERQGASAFAAQMQEVMDDPEFAKIFADLASASGAYFDEQTHEERPRDPGEAPEAPAGGQDGGGGGGRVRVVGEEDEASPETKFASQQAALEGADFTSAQGQAVLGEVVLDVARALSGAAGAELTDIGRNLAQGIAPNAEDIESVLVQLGGAGGTAAAGADNVAAAAGLQQVLVALVDVMVAPPEVKMKAKKKAKDINPFGSIGAVKINNETMDKDKAKKFLRNAKKYIPYLVLWDLVLKMIAGHIGQGRGAVVRQKFKPGFVLDPAVRGLATSDGVPGTTEFKAFVLLEPLHFADIVAAHKDRPWAIASYLHGVGSHELAHLPRMGQGHNESWAREREDIGFATAHLLPAIEALVVKALKLKDVRLEAKINKADLRKIRAEEAAKAQAKVQKRVHDFEGRLLQAEADVKTHGREAERWRQIAASVGDSSTKVADIIHRIQALVDFHEFRNFTRIHGPTFLPAGLSSEAFLSAIDRHPLDAAQVILA